MIQGTTTKLKIPGEQQTIIKDLGFGESLLMMILAVIIALVIIFCGFMLIYTVYFRFLKILVVVRKYTKDFELNEAVELAVNECIHDNILSDFLRANKAEVISMSIFEYDKELEERKLRKAEYEAGVADGIKTATENTTNMCK